MALGVARPGDVGHVDHEGEVLDVLAVAADLHEHRRCRRTVHDELPGEADVVAGARTTGPRTHLVAQHVLVDQLEPLGLAGLGRNGHLVGDRAVHRTDIVQLDVCRAGVDRHVGCAVAVRVTLRHDLRALDGCQVAGHGLLLDLLRDRDDGLLTDGRGRRHDVADLDDGRLGVDGGLDAERGAIDLELELAGLVGHAAAARQRAVLGGETHLDAGQGLAVRRGLDHAGYELADLTGDELDLEPEAQELLGLGDHAAGTLADVRELVGSDGPGVVGAEVLVADDLPDGIGSLGGDQLVGGQPVGAVDHGRHIGLGLGGTRDLADDMGPYVLVRAVQAEVDTEADELAALPCAGVDAAGVAGATRQHHTDLLGAGGGGRSSRPHAECHRQGDSDACDDASHRGSPSG